ncbi:MAG: ATP-binding cassette domain-containing protein [Mesorhizobium sp.]|nr:MAG: ATP-binding cassette domain-containing protein [Mesorhizobium sp.]
MAEVSLKGVKKSFGRVEIIKGVDIHINDGEFVVFVGPSGCGKSTLLRMIAGLEDITEGTLEIGGRVVNQLQPKQRGVAMVFQSYAIFPHMTVRENIAFGLTIAGASRQEKQQKVAEAARILQMEHLLDRRPSQLSGGQRQRVAVARAIVRRPAFVVADEPVSALDMTVQKQILLLIRLLQERHGFACLFVSHDLGAVEQVADRVAVMQDGRIVEIGDRDDVFDRPRHAYTRALLDAAMLIDRHFADGASARKAVAR